MCVTSTGSHSAAIWSLRIGSCAERLSGFPLCTTAADVLWHSSALVTAALQHELMCQFLLQARGFGAAQVSHLVCALFEPTEFRARLIEEIEG